MRFKIDENLHDSVSELLTGQGHDAHTVHSEGLRGTQDANLAELCRNEGRVLVTLDLDFADIRAYPPAQYAGMIVLRLRDQSRQHVIDILTRTITLLSHEPLDGRLWIVSESWVRIRR